MSETEKNTAEVSVDVPPGDELYLLDPGAQWFRSERGRLHWQYGAAWLEVSLARLFPLSEPEEWIAVLNTEGKELGVLATLHGLPHESLSAVREELAHRYLIPRITRILSGRERFGILEWEVETDRGPATFQMRNSAEHIHHGHGGGGENVQQSSANRLSLTDVEGNRYDIPDIEALDAASRKHLELVL